MNNYIDVKSNGIELGSGTGVTKEFVNCDDFKISDFSNDPWLDLKMIDAQKTQLPDEFLDICDKFSMGHSLEVRPPFLDNNLTNFLFSIPSHIRVGNKTNLKKLLKSSYKNLLPFEILTAKKKCFILPIENWLKKQLSPLLSFHLSKKKLNEHELFKDNIYDEIVKPFLNRSFIFSKFDPFHRKQTLIWGILLFQLWYEKVIQKKSIIL
jgi:asparagine synthase (glutamine-hydrolysing)